MGMTIVEKILARASGAAKVSPGDMVVVDVDCVVLYDGNFFSFGKAGTRDVLKIKDPDRVVVIFDHEVPAPTAQAAALQDGGRAFVKQFGIKRFHDVGRSGICHAVVADNAYALPGSVLVASDSHTCSAGAFNCAARGVAGPDIMFALATGQTWFKVGETIRYDLNGRLPRGVSMKDVFLHIAGTFGAHATQNVEFGGSGLPYLSINARRTMTTMGAELSAEFATFEADDVLIDYVKQRNQAPFEPQAPDADAKYKDRRAIDLSRIEPLVALPDAVINNSVPVGQVAGTVIQQAFIGSCANGTLDDLAAAASVVAGRQVAPGVRLIVTPATQAIYLRALKAGYVETLMEAGAVVTNATCGACFGGHMGLLGPGETCLTSSTRNFKGRMGDPSARIYMASPATVAASALAGTITHPGEFFQGDAS